MSRVCDHPPKPIKAILTPQDHLDAGLTTRSLQRAGT